MISNRLKFLRSTHNIKQADLAKILSVSQSTISGWESERYEIDNFNLRKIAEYFNVSIDYLLCHTDNEQIQNDKLADLNKILDKDIVHFQKSILSAEDKSLLKQILQRIFHHTEAP